MLRQKQTLQAGAIFGLLGVALGAFGAHALKSILIANNSVDTYELAVRYQFYHAFALLVIGLLMEKITNKSLGYSALCMTIGILLFSGSLYALAFKVGKIVAFITPIGGVFLIIGWLLVALSFMKNETKKA
jgi:uncharacterized membrane protein YgdD (TMEM256/DUF423 family)